MFLYYFDCVDDESHAAESYNIGRTNDVSGFDVGRAFIEAIRARISKCVPTHIFLRKNLNYRNYITFLNYWKPRHCSIWM